MKISISVLTYNSSKTMSECLDSLLLECNKQHTSFDYEINILNNGSNDDTKKVIHSKKGKINYYENKLNQSFTKSFNYLLSKSDGDYYCMTSDDIIFSNGIIKYMNEFYSDIKNKHVVTAPKSFLPNLKLDRINKKELKEKDLILNFTILGNILMLKDEGLDQYNTVNSQVLQDSCLFFSDSIKPNFYFDERFKFYFTEDVLCKHLKNNNYVLLYNTEVSVKHYLKVATKKSKNTKMNMIYFKDCITYSSIYSNKLFHYILFLPLIYITIFLKYIKWTINPKRYV